MVGKQKSVEEILDDMEAERLGKERCRSWYMPRRINDDPEDERIEPGENKYSKIKIKF